MIRPKKQSISGNDLGFGNTPTVNNQRMLNKDGSSNVRRTGLPFFRTSDTYNRLITMNWSNFMLLIVGVYMLINFLFAGLYIWIGIEHLSGANSTDRLGQFFDAFFFSAQTISTVGYGHISPKGMTTSFLAAFESMLGLLAFALATGLLYGRFSRPTAKIIYSKDMVVAPYGDGKALMFRMANLRSSQLIDIEVQLMFSVNVNEGGKITRKFISLDLERTKINFLTLSWTVVHPITENSPIHDLNALGLNEGNAEFMVVLKAFDDTFSQTVHSRTSYHDNEVVWDAKFDPVISNDTDGVSTLDYQKIGAYTMLNSAS